MVPCDESKQISFASSIMKNIIVFVSQSRFQVKMICCIAFDQHLVFFAYLSLLLSSYNALIMLFQLCYHLLDQLKFFKCCHKFLDNF